MNISKNRVERIMAEKQLTLGAVAETSGIASQNVSAILRRGRCIPVTAGRIAMALGVDVAEIVDGVGKEAE